MIEMDKRTDLEDQKRSKAPRNGKKNSKGRYNGKRNGRGTNTSQNKMPATNDSSWYTSNAKLVEASARVPFPYRPGLPVPDFYADVDTTLSFSGSSATAKIPGVFVIDWAPSVGISKDVTSPISLAARDIFSKVRAAFSGSIQADAPDFIIHMMALDSIYAYIAFLKRMYKAIVSFNPDNQISPEVLLQAMGWTQTSIYKLMADKVHLFGVINELIAMANRFRTPNVMPVFQRHAWMSERVYTDAPTLNSQLYLFNLTNVYKFTTEASGAGMLESVQMPTSVTVDDLFTFGRELIEALSNWDDAYIINGYLAKAYEGTPNFSIAELQMDDRMELVYNEVVLSQIENATTAPARLQQFNGTIKQIVNTNALNTSYSANVQSASVGKGATWTVNRINCRQDQPSAVDTIEATRLMTKWSMTGSTASVVQCGTEIVVNFRVMVYQKMNNAWVPVNVNNMLLPAVAAGQTSVTVLATNLSNFINAYLAFSSFDWHPIMLAGSQIRDKLDAPTSTTDYVGLLGDIHNITFISDKDMDYINRCCLYSEFGSFGA